MSPATAGATAVRAAVEHDMALGSIQRDNDFFSQQTETDGMTSEVDAVAAHMRAHEATNRMFGNAENAKQMQSTACSTEARVDEQFGVSSCPQLCADLGCSRRQLETQLHATATAYTENFGFNLHDAGMLFKAPGTIPQYAMLDVTEKASETPAEVSRSWPVETKRMAFFPGLWKRGRFICTLRGSSVANEPAICLIDTVSIPCPFSLLRCPIRCSLT